MLPGKRFLFISAHPDDAEFGAGGTISRLHEEGREIFLIVLSNPVMSLPNGFNSESLILEQHNAADILRIDENKIIYFDYPVRRFNENRQDILEDLIIANREINPDVIFTSGINDVHQDHSQCGYESIRAFRKKIICFYDMPWNSIKSTENIYIQLEERHIKNKIKAIQCYRSQSHRRYADTQYIKGWAKMRGVYSDYEYAESFELATMSIPSIK